MRRHLRVLFLEPFDGGSHRAFARGWSARSRHDVRLEALPPRFWKWRLRGAAFRFAEKTGRRLGHFDAVLATSLLNAGDFAAATRLDLPLVVYFHENQLSYPRPPGEPLDHGLALASLASAAAADRLVFNSAFHRAAFFDGLESWLGRFPEEAPRATVRALARRTSVIPPGIDWDRLAPLARRQPLASAAPLILWNHRWEFDKNPATFFGVLGEVAKRGLDFRLALLGENAQFVPKPFLEARERFGPRVVRYGFVRSADAYRAWLGRADIVVSTARQENFGIAVAEAIAAGAFPLLPRRLSYPGLLPARFHSACLYETRADLVARLARLLAEPERATEGRRERSLAMRRYDWSRLAPRLDSLLDRAVASHRPR